MMVAYTKFKFGNVNLDIDSGVSPKIVPMFLCTLRKINILFELKNNDTELQVTYQAHVSSKRVQESFALKVLLNMSICNELETHEVIQYLGCTLATVDQWERKSAEVFEKKYVYRTEEFIVPKIAEMLEEWRTFLGEPYVQGDVVEGLNHMTGKFEKLKLALT